MNYRIIVEYAGCQYLGEEFDDEHLEVLLKFLGDIHKLDCFKLAGAKGEYFFFPKETLRRSVIAVVPTVMPMSPIEDAPVPRCPNCHAPLYRDVVRLWCGCGFDAKYLSRQ